MSDPMQISRMITGAWVSQMVYVVAKLGLADRLKDSPATASELAAEMQLHGSSTFRLCRALASLGLLCSDNEGRFQLAPLGESLCSDVPGSQRALAIMMGEEHYRCWGELLHSVRTGEKAFDHLYGEPIFDYLGKHPEAARTFDAAMTSVHGRESDPMARSFDFSRFNRLIDVGGGNASLMMTILSHYPTLKGTIYDLPGVIERTHHRVAQSEFADRIELVAGNFFESIPSGGDCYLMRHIIHDWDDSECATILGNCRAAMPDNGTLLIAESVIPEGDEPFFGKLLDLTMLLIPGGKERTEPEYRRLLAANGFILSSLIPTGTEVSFVVARLA